MYKYFLFFIYLLSLSAQEPTLAKLLTSNTNEFQRFSIANTSFICRPYGVLSLDQLYKQSSLKSQCKEKIQSYYLANPQDYYFLQNLLKRGQWYHIEFKKESCVVYAKGQYSISELLLLRGLAVRKPNFRDLEFKASFYKAQKIARAKKVGIWKDEIVKSCLDEMYK